MFNVTVIKLKDIIKFTIILILIYVSSKFLLKKISIKDYLNQSISFNTSDFITIGINNESNLIKQISKQKLTEEPNEKLEERKNFFSVESILQTSSSIFIAKDIKKDKSNDENIEVDGNVSISENKGNITNETKNEEIETIQENVSTEVVTQNPIKENYNKDYAGVKIKNQTSFELNEDTLNPSDLQIDKKNVIIFHTHTCESYTQSAGYEYNATGNYRTTDLNFSVARVGEELKNNLINYGFNVNHNLTYHDYPNYTGSYTRSLSTVQNVLKDFKSDIIIDLHRDAIGSNSSYAPTVKIGEDYAAQIMFVMGTDGGGLSHSNWNSNLKFAVKLQQKGNELYPGLFKPIILRNSRYNQHLGKAACIIEVGATGNTLEQCLTSAKYFSKVMYEALLSE